MKRNVNATRFRIGFVSEVSVSVLSPLSLLFIRGTYTGTSPKNDLSFQFDVDSPVRTLHFQNIASCLSWCARTLLPQGFGTTTLRHLRVRVTANTTGHARSVQDLPVQPHEQVAHVRVPDQCDVTVHIIVQPIAPEALHRHDGGEAVLSLRRPGRVSISRRYGVCGICLHRFAFVSSSRRTASVTSSSCPLSIARLKM